MAYLFDTANRMNTEHFTLLMAPAPDGKNRVLVVAGRKIGSAVERNRARRRLRELGRRLIECLEGEWWIGLIARPSAVMAGWADMVRQAATAARKLACRAGPKGREQ